MWRLASPGTLELSSGHLFPGMTFTAQSKGVSHLVSSDHMFLTPDRYSESGGRKNIYWVVCVCVCVCVCACVFWRAGAYMLSPWDARPGGHSPSFPPLACVACVLWLGSLLWRAWPVCCGWGPGWPEGQGFSVPRAVSPFLAKETADVSKLKMWRGGDDSGLPVGAQGADGGACDRGSRARVNRR